MAAKKTIELYSDKHEIRVINNPVIEEDSDNLRFLRDVERWIGVSIEFATNKKWPSNSARDVWSLGFMSNRFGAECTRSLKKAARQQWEEKNKPDFHVLGFTADEVTRHNRFIKTERDNLLPVLISLNITKAECFKIIEDAGIKLPRVYSMGYPNANCIGCVKATSPTYWNHVRKMHPEVFADRAAQSRELGARLVRVKNERIFLDELSPNAKGRPMKTMTLECGIFCEEQE